MTTNDRERKRLVVYCRKAGHQDIADLLEADRAIIRLREESLDRWEKIAAEQDTEIQYLRAKVEADAVERDALIHERYWMRRNAPLAYSQYKLWSAPRADDEKEGNRE